MLLLLPRCMRVTGGVVSAADEPSVASRSSPLADCGFIIMEMESVFGPFIGDDTSSVRSLHAAENS